jgi:hypothetical protein
VGSRVAIGLRANVLLTVRRASVRTLIVGLGAVALVAVAPMAQAATSYGSAGQFATEAFIEPTELAVDEQSGDVLVAGVVEATRARVGVYDPEDPSASPTSFGEAELSLPYGIAIDQSNGDVYVSDRLTNRILRYSTDRATPPTYSLDPTYVSPVQGPDAEAGEIGSFASALAVDPTNGDLLVADSGNNYVQRFDSDGSFLGAFDGSGYEGGAFTSLLDIAVLPNGEIYLIRDGTFSTGAVVSGSRVGRFGGDGGGGAMLEAEVLGRARSLSFDPALGNLIVATGGGDNSTYPQLSVFHQEALVETFAYVPPAEEFAFYNLPVAMVVGPTGQLFVLNSRYVNSFVPTAVKAFNPISLPTLEPPSGIRPTGADLATAHLAGTVNPLGKPAKYHFEYSADGGSSWASTPELDAGSGEGPVPVQADPTLAVDVDYQARLVIASNGTSKASTVRVFSTPRTPLVATSKADHFNATTAIVRGSVNPRGQATTYRFEYGTSPAYGSQTPGVAVGEGDAEIEVDQALAGLRPATAYHYRLVAENFAGTRAGEDRTFTTLLGPRPLSPRLPAAAPTAAAPRKHCGKGRRARRVDGKRRCVRVHRHQR